MITQPVLLRGIPLPQTGSWKLRAVAAAVAAAREPEARQTQLWKSLGRAKLPRKVKDLVRQVSRKKLPVGQWMQSIGLSRKDRWPPCGRVEDNVHRFKKCLYLEITIQLTRDLYHPIKDRKRKIIEPSRICLEH